MVGVNRDCFRNRGRGGGAIIVRIIETNILNGQIDLKT